MGMVCHTRVLGAIGQVSLRICASHSRASCITLLRLAQFDTLSYTVVLGADGQVDLHICAPDELS